MRTHIVLLYCLEVKMSEQKNRVDATKLDVEQAGNGFKVAWSQPLMTVIDVADLTKAGSNGATDGGIFT